MTYRILGGGTVGGRQGVGVMGTEWAIKAWQKIQDKAKEPDVTL